MLYLSPSGGYGPATGTVVGGGLGPLVEAFFAEVIDDVRFLAFYLRHNLDDWYAKLNLYGPITK